MIHAHNVIVLNNKKEQITTTWSNVGESQKPYPKGEKSHNPKLHTMGFYLCDTL